jgi:hypothetical protein
MAADRSSAAQPRIRLGTVTIGISSSRPNPLRAASSFSGVLAGCVRKDDHLASSTVSLAKIE